MSDVWLYIFCIIDFENQAITDEAVYESRFKEKIISYVKKELKILRQIDKVIEEFLRSDDNFSFQRDLGIYPIQFIEKYDCIDVKENDYSFRISKENIDKLKRGYRILYVVECTIFVPILSAPKWIKGLIGEKKFEMQIRAPGFTVDDEKLHLEIIEFDSELRETLKQIARGRLLVLYIRRSQVIE